MKETDNKYPQREQERTIQLKSGEIFTIWHEDEIIYGELSNLFSTSGRMIADKLGGFTPTNPDFYVKPSDGMDYKIFNKGKEALMRRYQNILFDQWLYYKQAYLNGDRHFDNEEKGL